jgi:hypothetical protein
MKFHSKVAQRRHHIIFHFYPQIFGRVERLIIEVSPLYSTVKSMLNLWINFSPKNHF